MDAGRVAVTKVARPLPARNGFRPETVFLGAAVGGRYYSAARSFPPRTSSRPLPILATMTTSGPTRSLALAGALTLLAACASAAGPASGSPPPSCASAALPADDAGLAAAFDSLHTLRVRGRAADSLVLTPYDTPPRLDNRSEVARLFKTLYPGALRDAGVGGTAEVAALIDTSGTMGNIRLVRGSTYHELDLATYTVVRGMRFRPARQGGCPVPYFMSVPITWEMERAQRG